MEPAVRKKCTGASSPFLWNPKTLNCFMVFFWMTVKLPYDFLKTFFLYLFIFKISACWWCWHASDERLRSWLPSLSLVSWAWFLLSLPCCCCCWWQRRSHRFMVLYEFVNLCFHSNIVWLDLRSVSRLAIWRLWHYGPPPTQLPFKDLWDLWWSDWMDAGWNPKHRQYLLLEG